MRDVGARRLSDIVGLRMQLEQERAELLRRPGDHGGDGDPGPGVRQVAGGLAPHGRLGQGVRAGDRHRHDLPGHEGGRVPGGRGRASRCLGSKSKNRGY